MAYQAIGTAIRDGGGAIPSAQNRQLRMTMIGGGLILLLVGLGLIVTAALFHVKLAHLRDDSQTIVADVLDSQVTRTMKRGTVMSTRYEVKYRFQVPGKAAVTSDWEEGPEDAVRVANATGTIQVRYLPSDPSVNLPAAALDGPTASATVALWRAGVGGSLLLLGCVLLVVAYTKRGAGRPTAGATSSAR